MQQVARLAYCTASLYTEVAIERLWDFAAIEGGKAVREKAHRKRARTMVGNTKVVAPAPEQLGDKQRQERLQHQRDICAYFEHLNSTAPTGKSRWAALRFNVVKAARQQAMQSAELEKQKFRRSLQVAMQEDYARRISDAMGSPAVDPLKETETETVCTE